jgi:hypothetical protein
MPVIPVNKVVDKKRISNGGLRRGEALGISHPKKWTQCGYISDEPYVPCICTYVGRQIANTRNLYVRLAQNYLETLNFQQIVNPTGICLQF